MGILQDILGNFIRETTQEISRELTSEICEPPGSLIEHLSDIVIDERPRGYSWLDLIKEKE